MTLIRSIPLPKALNCWNEIGISGDRSCPELAEHIHCRNCPVFAKAAQGFFDRTAPSGYLQEWTVQLSGSLETANKETSSVLIFRLDHEWFAVSCQAVVEVTTPRPLHTIPRRKSPILEGMVNLRGQLQLQVSLKILFGIAQGGDPATKGSAASGSSRLVVLKRSGVTWVFLADEVLEVRRFPRTEMKNVPSTLAHAGHSFSKAVLLGEKRTIGYLDDERLFEALRDIQG